MPQVRGPVWDCQRKVKSIFQTLSSGSKALIVSWWCVSRGRMSGSWCILSSWLSSSSPFFFFFALWAHLLYLPGEFSCRWSSGWEICPHSWCICLRFCAFGFECPCKSLGFRKLERWWAPNSLNKYGDLKIAARGLSAFQVALGALPPVMDKQLQRSAAYPPPWLFFLAFHYGHHFSSSSMCSPIYHHRFC